MAKLAKSPGRHKLISLRQRLNKQVPHINVAVWPDGSGSIMVSDDNGDVASVMLNNVERAALIQALSWEAPPAAAELEPRKGEP